jgi:hypothetical protein
MQILLVAHIPGYTMVPGNPLSSYRKVVDWAFVPRVGDHVQLGVLITPVDEVVVRQDGRPEVHFLRYPSLGGMDDLARFAQDLAMHGFAGDGSEWERRVTVEPNPAEVIPEPRRERSGRHAGAL